MIESVVLQFDNPQNLNFEISDYFSELYTQFKESDLRATDMVAELDRRAVGLMPEVFTGFAKLLFELKKEKIGFEVVMGLPGAGKTKFNEAVALALQSKGVERAVSQTGTNGVTKPAPGSEYELVFRGLNQLTEFIKQRGLDETGQKVYYRGEMMTVAFLLDQLRLFISGADVVVGDVFPRRASQAQVLDNLVTYIRNYYSDQGQQITVNVNRVFILRSSISDAEILQGLQLHSDFSESASELAKCMAEVRQDIENGSLHLDTLESAVAILNKRLEIVTSTRLRGQAQTLGVIWQSVILKSATEGLQSRLDSGEERSDNDVNKFMIRLCSDFIHYSQMLGTPEFLVQFIANPNPEDPTPMLEQYLAL